MMIGTTSKLAPPIQLAAQSGAGRPALAARAVAEYSYEKKKTELNSFEWMEPPIYVKAVLSGEVDTQETVEAREGPYGAQLQEDPGEGWSSHHKGKPEIWGALQQEAREHADREPALASELHSSVLVHKSLESSMAFILANKLSSESLLSTNLMQIIMRVYTASSEIVDDAVADLQAVRDRDPAAHGYLQALLFQKGFQAVQAHRVSHYLWNNARQSLAYALQSRISQQFDVDIHPGAHIGRGLMMDHATGVVIGETAVVGDNVSMLHRVTLGGSGISTGLRHPTIGHGVLLGAGATVLGPIHVGHSSKIGAGSVVVQCIPEKSVAVGVPARVIKRDKKLEPCKDMDQADDYVLDYMI